MKEQFVGRGGRRSVTTTVKDKQTRTTSNKRREDGGRWKNMKKQWMSEKWERTTRAHKHRKRL